MEEKVDNRTFKPTVEWMAEKYNEMNNWLFNGELGQCDFDIFTTGKGSQGHYLGLFSRKCQGLKIDRSRRSYLPNSGDKKYVTRDNFYEVCMPTILLNGNYSGTEEAFLTTLVHEMCHYYCYMYGLCPKQSHGREFRYICSIIQVRSNGRFAIKNVASAEQMSQMDLCPKMQAIRAKREENKALNSTALLIFMKNEEIHLFRTSAENKSLVDTAIKAATRNGKVNKILLSSDVKVMNKLARLGYTRNFRRWRWWNLRRDDKEPIQSVFEEANTKVVYGG